MLESPSQASTSPPNLPIGSTARLGRWLTLEAGCLGEQGGEGGVAGRITWLYVVCGSSLGSVGAGRRGACSDPLALAGIGLGAALVADALEGPVVLNHPTAARRWQQGVVSGIELFRM